MSELLPCPFCSAEPEILNDGRRTWGLVQHNDGCLFPVYPKHEIPESDFAAWNSRVDYHGYEQAAIEAWESIKAWNSRAERTCEFNIKDNMNETEGMGDVWIECSACNCVFDFYADEWLMKMSYCPNCGCKVVGE